MSAATARRPLFWIAKSSDEHGRVASHDNGRYCSRSATMIAMVLAAIVMFRFAGVARAATWPEPTEGT
jgi:hypothetical protein